MILKVAQNEIYDKFSFRNNILIVSAITGTNNWTSAAIVFSKKGKILYHKEYPRADIIAPEQIANKKPIKLNFITSGYMIRLKKIIGKVKIKFDIVVINGSFELFPLIV